MESCGKCVNKELCEEWARQHEAGMSSCILYTYVEGGHDCDYFISQSDIRMMQ